MLAADRFVALLRAIELSPAERTAGTAATERLRAHLARTPRLVSSTRLIGAWDKGTEIRPPRDIDLLVVLPRVLDLPGSPGGNAPLEILHDLKEAIVPLVPAAHLRRDGKAIIAAFPDSTVEVSAGFSRGGGRYDACDASDGGRYRRLAPDAERGALQESDRCTKGCTRSLVKLFKAWQSYRTVPISSFAIELVLVEFLARWEHASDGARYYDWMVRDAFASLVSRASGALPLPGTSSRFPIGQAWLSLARTAHRHAAKACEAETLGRDRDAWWEWSQIFGDAVPMDAVGH